MFIIAPPPLQGTVGDWFMIFQNNWLVGLVDMDLFLVVDNVFLIAILLALYVVLKRASESIMAIATALGLLSVVCYVVTNPAFQMLSLSDKYVAATTDAQKTIFLAAGQAILVAWQGSAFQVAYIAGSIAGIAIGLVMLRSSVFGRATAYMGILSNLVGFGLYVPAIGVYISVFSVFFLEIWYILIARRFFQLGQMDSPQAALVSA